MAKVEIGRHTLHSANSYTNPVFERSFPDPFVLKFGGLFYGYSTGFSSDGRGIFPVIRSKDLVGWEAVGAAMDPLETAPPLYWAPEVTYSDGTFYLYYSCGNEVNMELRVAVSERPEGGFVDSGVRLTNEQFAIDAHVFIDDDGEKYLFYATDFLSHSHIGTGTVVDRMVDWFQLEGRARPVTRAKYDWQVYDPCRSEKGNVRWHTVEGPSVLKRKGTYFQMFSGGNWKNESYGVGYATSHALLNSEEWKQSIDGTTILPILRSSEGVLGPGHNSVVFGPNSRELFCVYHSWVNDERVMSIDRMDIVGDRMFLLGPTVSGQPLPFKPRTAKETVRPGARMFDRVSRDFLLETTLRLASNEESLRITILRADGMSIVELKVTRGKVYFQSYTGSGSPAPVELRTTSDFEEYQCLWMEVNGQKVQLRLNGLLWFETHLESASAYGRIEVESSLGAEVLNLDLTEGFVDLFDEGRPVEASGWQGITNGTVLALAREGLTICSDGEIAVAAKGSCFGEFEYAANLRAPFDSAFGFAVLTSANEIEMLIEFAGEQPLAIDEDIRKEVVEYSSGSKHSAFTQYRFVKQGHDLLLDVEGFDLARYKVSSRPSRIGIVTNGGLLVDMVRMIRIDT